MLNVEIFGGEFQNISFTMLSVPLLQNAQYSIFNQNIQF
jgi:hypothetical protein